MPRLVRCRTSRLDLDHGLGIDAGERLVEQHVVRTAGERAGDLDPPALAAGERDRRRLAMARDAEFLEQRVEVGLAPAPVRLHHLEHRADIVLDVEAAEDRGFLRQIADPEPRALIHRKVGDVVAVELDLAAIGLDQPGDHVERGGLAGAVRPEQADRLAAPHVEAHVLDDLAAAIALFDAMGGEIAVGVVARRPLGLRAAPPARLCPRGAFGPGGGCGPRAGEHRRAAQERPADRSAERPEVDVPAAVRGFSFPPRQATVSEHRQDIEHACLEAADSTVFVRYELETLPDSNKSPPYQHADAVGPGLPQGR